jgi:hypothetical protein
MSKMRIHEIFIRDLYGIKEFDAYPRATPFEIAGRNALGKTSVLKAIRAIFNGTRDADIVRQGAGVGMGKIVFGTHDGTMYDVERVFGAATKVTVRNLTQDTTQKSPATFLKHLSSVLAYDPLKFIAMPPRERFATLAQLADHDATRADFIAALRRAVEAREDKVTIAESNLFDVLLAAMPAFIQRPMLEVAGEMAEIIGKAAKESGSALLGAEARAGAYECAATFLRDGVEYSEAAAHLDWAAGELRAKLSATAQRQRTDNAAIALLTDALPRMLIRERGLQVAGIEVDEHGATWNGLAMPSLSGAERLRVATWIAERLIGDTGLRVLLVDGMEALDANRRRELLAWSFAANVQLIGTRVADTVLSVNFNHDDTDAVDYGAEVQRALA